MSLPGSPKVSAGIASKDFERERSILLSPMPVTPTVLPLETPLDFKETDPQNAVKPETNPGSPSNVPTSSTGLGKYFGFLNPFSSVGSAVDLTAEEGKVDPNDKAKISTDYHIAAIKEMSSKYPVTLIPNNETEIPEVRKFTYADFTQRLKGTDFTRILKTFVKDLLQSSQVHWNVCHDVHRFSNSLMDAISRHPTWNGAGDAELDNAAESIEKFCMANLYKRLFESMTPAFQTHSQGLSRMLYSLSWVEPQHLDIPAPYWSPTTFDMAAAELRKMDDFKAPYDKMVCLLNACQVIMTWMKQVHTIDSERMLREKEERRVRKEQGLEVDEETQDAKKNRKSKSIGIGNGADNFLPLFLYVLIQSQPANLMFNLEYIGHARSPQRLTGLHDYYYTHLRSVVTFVECADANMFTVDPETYARNVLEYGLKFDELQTVLPPVKSVSTTKDAIPLHTLSNSMEETPTYSQLVAEDAKRREAELKAASEPVAVPVVLPVTSPKVPSSGVGITSCVQSAASLDHLDETELCVDDSVEVPSQDSIGLPLLSLLHTVMHTSVSLVPLHPSTITLDELPALLNELEVLRGMVVTIQSVVRSDETLNTLVKGCDDIHTNDLRLDIE